MTPPPENGEVAPPSDSAVPEKSAQTSSTSDQPASAVTPPENVNHAPSNFHAESTPPTVTQNPSATTATLPEGEETAPPIRDAIQEDQILASAAGNASDAPAKTKLVVELNAATYTDDELIDILQNDAAFFEQLDFFRCNKDTLDKLFPFVYRKGKKKPHSDHRKTAALIRKWRNMTHHEQERHIEKTRVGAERERRIRKRQREAKVAKLRADVAIYEAKKKGIVLPKNHPALKASELATRLAQAAASGSAEETELEKQLDAATTASRKRMREEGTTKGRPNKKGASLPRPIGEPPVTVAQQNDNAALAARDELFRAATKFIKTVTPAEELAPYEYPKQELFLLIKNGVVDPNVDGRRVPEFLATRGRPQLITLTCSRESAKEMARVAKDAIDTTSPNYRHYEHIDLHNQSQVNDYIVARDHDRNNENVKGVPKQMAWRVPTWVRVVQDETTEGTMGRRRSYSI